MTGKICGDRGLLKRTREMEEALYQGLLEN
jgi:hypothetical protein